MRTEIGHDVLARNMRLGTDGKYQIRRMLHRSELSIVYAVRRADTGTMSVIKEFFPRLLARRAANGKSVEYVRASLSPQFIKLLEAFQEEAAILQDLQHPGIVQFEDYFEEHGTAYLVMEHCHGKTLDVLLRDSSDVLARASLRQVMLPVIEALRYIHSKGYIHRDIKPSNIWVDEGGRGKLLDFGSATRYQDRGHAIFTTAGYSPLELYSEKSSQGPVSDIYSLAATLYYCCSGTAPIAVPTRLFEDQLKPLRASSKDISPFLSRIIHWGLALTPSKRCRSLHWFKAALVTEGVLRRPRQVNIKAND